MALKHKDVRASRANILECHWLVCIQGEGLTNRSIKVSVHNSTIRKRLGKNGIHGSSPRQKRLLTKKNTKVHLTFTKKYFGYPQDFWANILWTDETKVELFWRCVFYYIWHKTHIGFDKKSIIPTVKHGGGGSVMSEAVLQLQELDNLP